MVIYFYFYYYYFTFSISISIIILFLLSPCGFNRHCKFISHIVKKMSGDPTRFLRASVDRVIFCLGPA